MIRKQQNIIKKVNGKLTTVGTVYMKTHRVVVELGGYKFKSGHMDSKKALNERYEDILFRLNPDSPNADGSLFFRDGNHSFSMSYVVISPNLVVTSSDLGWEDGTHTLKDLHDYHKEVSGRTLV